MQSNTYLEQQEQRKEELLDLLDQHDCRLNSDNGCMCEYICQELSDMSYDFPPLQMQEQEPY